MKTTINRKVRVHGIFAGDVAAAKALSIGAAVFLARESGNKFDTNAVMVMAKKEGWFSSKVVKIGYLDKVVAKRVADLIDAGINLSSVVAYFKDHNNDPVIEVRITNV
jgi:hypothetical protein